jgi:hypothetical protein
VTVSTGSSAGGSTTTFVDVQPITNIKHTAIHPNTVGERKLLAVLIRPLVAFFGGCAIYSALTLPTHPMVSLSDSALAN